MKIAAIICEYDPFHHGHAYHIEKTRQAGATHVVCIMSGAFVERATPAAVSRAARVKAALLGGADLVIDLPVPWACAGAQIFARGGVGLADALGCVELLSFGSECGNIGLIKTAARAINDPAVFALLKENLDSGESFAAIRQKAVEAVFPQVAGLLSNPNDTLGIEYVAALEALGSSVEPMCVSRKGAPHDSNVTDGIFASASAVRKLMTAGESFENLVPKGAYEIFLHEVEEGRAPAEVSRLESAILYKLRTSSPADFRKLPDVSEGIENRIVSAAKSAVSLDDVYSFAKTKRYSHARLRRIVTSLMLGIEKSDSEGIPPYIRVLGMNEHGREILRCTDGAGLPVVMRTSDIKALDERAQRIFELECRAADIRALCTPVVAPCGSEQTAKFISI